MGSTTKQCLLRTGPQVEHGHLAVVRPTGSLSNREQECMSARQELWPEVVGLAALAVWCRQYHGRSAIR
jgi:hypothetical protein